MSFLKTAAVAALAASTLALTAPTADAHSYGYRSYGYGHSYGYKSYGYSYGYRSYGYGYFKPSYGYGYGHYRKW